MKDSLFLQMGTQKYVLIELVTSPAQYLVRGNCDAKYHKVCYAAYAADTQGTCTSVQPSFGTSVQSSFANSYYVGLHVNIDLAFGAV